MTPLAYLAGSHIVNHSVDYGQVDVVGLIITVVSSHITTANGSVISSNLLVNYWSHDRVERSVDRVYITDDDNDNIVVVKVWDGVEVYINTLPL